MKKLLALILLTVALSGYGQECALVRKMPTLSPATEMLLTNCTFGEFMHMILTDTNAQQQIINALGVTNCTITLSINPNLFISSSSSTNNAFGTNTTLIFPTNRWLFTLQLTNSTLAIADTGFNWSNAPAWNIQSTNPISISASNIALYGTNGFQVYVGYYPGSPAPASLSINPNTGVITLITNVSIAGSETVNQGLSVGGNAFVVGTNNVGTGEIGQWLEIPTTTSLYWTNQATGQQFVFQNGQFIASGGTAIGSAGGGGSVLTGTNRLSGPIYLTRGDNTSISAGVNADVTLGTTNSSTYISGMAGNFTLVGFAGAWADRQLTLINTNPWAMTIANNSGSEGAAGNRILTGIGQDMTFTNIPTVATFQYDATLSRWLLKTVNIPGGGAVGAAVNSTNAVVYYSSGGYALRIDPTQGFKVYNTNGNVVFAASGTATYLADYNGTMGIQVVPNLVTITTNLNVAGTVTASNLVVSGLYKNLTTSNQVMVASELYPYNIYPGPGNITATSGGHIFSGDPGCFAGFQIGYNFVLTNAQYVVADIFNASNVLTYNAAQQTYSGPVVWTVYPNAQRESDINRNQAGAIGNDGSFMTIGTTFGSGRSYGFFVFSDTNSWNIDAEVREGGRLAFQPLNFGNDSFSISPFAHYEAVDIDQSSLLRVWFGLTNKNGAWITNWVPTITMGSQTATNFTATSTNGIKMVEDDGTVVWLKASNGVPYIKSTP